MVATSSSTRMESYKSANLLISMKVPIMQPLVCTCMVGAKLTSGSAHSLSSPILLNKLLRTLPRRLKSATEFGYPIACFQTSRMPLMLQTCRQRVTCQISSIARRRLYTKKKEAEGKLASDARQSKLSCVG